MKMKKQVDLRTLEISSLCVTGSHDATDGIVLPIHTSSAFYYLDEGPQPYPRYFNTPNQEALAKRIASLEHAEDGLVFSSGMSAISTSILSLIKPGDHVLLLKGLYGGSHAFVTHEFTKWGIEFDFVDCSVEEFRAKRRENTVLAYVESPTNPCMGILDLRELGNVARELGFLTIVDNTFATPINQNPIDLGMNLVVHSATKYLGGHSDLSAGVVVGDIELIDKVRVHARRYGGNLNAQSCHLLERSIKTLDVRVQRQNENAMAVARFLDRHPSVQRVLYPGRESHPGHEAAGRQMRGFGGMMSFELKGDIPVRDFLTRLKLITPAMSLGGVESTVTVPVYTSHKAMSAEGQREAGVTPGLIRISIGIEAAADLVSDLEQAIGSFGTA